MFLLECVRPLQAHFQGNEFVKHLFESPPSCVVTCESESTCTSSATDPCVLVCGPKSSESEPLSVNCQASDPNQPTELKVFDEEHTNGDCSKIAGVGYWLELLCFSFAFDQIAFNMMTKTRPCGWDWMMTLQPSHKALPPYHEKLFLLPPLPLPSRQAQQQPFLPCSLRRTLKTIHQRLVMPCMRAQPVTQF